MSNQIYNSFKVQSMVGSINLTADSINVILVTSAYTPDIDNHTIYADVASNEVVGVGYTTSGQTLGGVTVIQNNTTDAAILDANSVTWTASTIDAAGAILYKKDGPTNSYLIGYIDFGEVKSSYNGDFLIEWNLNGILLLS